MKPKAILGNSFKCPKANCGKILKTKGGLKYHTIVHEKARPLDCANCKFKCISKSHLKYHTTRCSIYRRKYFITNRRYKCPFCPCKFRTTEQRDHHKKTHASVRKYICRTCTRRFMYKKDLARHMLTHTGRKPHVCPISICGRAFARRDNLRRHVKSKHKKSNLEAYRLVPGRRTNMQINDPAQPISDTNEPMPGPSRSMPLKNKSVKDKRRAYQQQKAIQENQRKGRKRKNPFVGTPPQRKISKVANLSRQVNSVRNERNERPQHEVQAPPADVNMRPMEQRQSSVENGEQWRRQEMVTDQLPIIYRISPARELELDAEEDLVAYRRAPTVPPAFYEVLEETKLTF